MPSLEFWQKLLATEAPPERLWPVVETARAAVIDLADVETWQGLNASDRDKAARSHPVPVGVSVLERSALPIHCQSSDWPVAVFVKGDARALDRPLVGIVGTRRVSPYGRTVAAHFAEAFAEAGCTVVSGGAIGVDSVAHEAALRARGPTACILPCGVDVAYPARHRDLFAKIAENGCLVSSFACGTAEQDHRLLARNRLVALLCQALVIVEAPAGSGSLVTAKFAREIGRPVFVVPGPVTQDTFKGSHDLIRSGATLTDDPTQVLDAIGITTRGKQDVLASVLEGDERAVYTSLQGLPRSTESIGDETGLSAQSVLAALTTLEIEGFAVRTPEGYALKP